MNYATTHWQCYMLKLHTTQIRSMQQVTPTWVIHFLMVNHIDF
jgi:hypothetical protein